MENILKIFIVFIIPLSYYIKNIEIMYAVALGYTTIIFILYKKISLKSIFSTNIIKYFTMLLLISLVSNMNLYFNNNQAFYIYLKPYIRIWIYLLFIINVYIVSSYNKFKNKVIDLVILSSLLPNIIGILQLKINFLTIIISKEGNRRIGSTFAHPNFYGYFLVIIIICILYKKNIALRYKNILNIYIFINLILLLETYSRTTFAFGVLIIILNFITNKKIKNKKIILPITMCLVVLSIILLYFKFDNLILSNSRFNVVKNYGSFYWRIMKWKTSAEYWINNKLAIFIGFGWMTSFIYAGDYKYLNFAMHNEYIRIIFETGLLGFLFFILFLKAVYKNIKECKDKEFRKFNYFIYLIFILGCLDGNLLGVPENTFYFLLFFSIVSNKLNMKGVEKHEKSTSHNKYVSI